MRHGDYAYAILWGHERLLLGKRGPHRRACPNCWDVLGGKVETGETLQQALIRELREEVGLTVRSFRKLAVLSEPEDAAHPIACYHIHVVDEWDGGEPSMQGHEHTELRWFRIAEACALRNLAQPEYRALFRRLGS